MKIIFATISKPNFEYSVKGFELYSKRLTYYHDLKIVHFKKDVTDKEILSSLKNSFLISLTPEGQQFSSEALATYLKDLEGKIRDVSFLIGGPEGLSNDILSRSNLKWSLGKLTYPHDLAMVVAMEAIYRASTINLGLPYHK